MPIVGIANTIQTHIGRLLMSDEFERWYEQYPHKVSKGAARRAFLTARKKASLEMLISGLEHYVRTKPARIDWCYPATWLNGERWLDQPAATYVPLTSTQGNLVFVSEETPQWRAWQQYLKATTGRGSPVKNFGWRFPTEWPPNVSRETGNA